MEIRLILNFPHCQQRRHFPRVRYISNHVTATLLQKFVAIVSFPILSILIGLNLNLKIPLLTFY